MPERILLVQLADRGDLILTTPAIAALREARPEAYLVLLTTSHALPLIEGTGLVDEVITFEREQFNSSRALLRPANLKRIFAIGQCDVVVFFHHFTMLAGTLKFWLIARACGAGRRLGLQNGKGWFLTESIRDEGFGVRHQAQYWLDLVALLGADPGPRPAIIKHKAYVFEHRGKKPRVVIHAGSGGYSTARRWEPEKFAHLADRLVREMGAQVLLVGGPSDDADKVEAVMQQDALNLTGKTSLPELVDLIAQADLYIGTDSGVTHIASATQTPILAIFGPSNASAWGPWNPHSHSHVLRSGVECSPCSYVGHGIGLKDGCAARTCMKLVTADEAFAAAVRLLQPPQAVIQPDSPDDSARLSRDWDRIEILKLPVDGIRYARWLDLIGEWVKGSIARHVCTVNPEFAIIAQTDSNFANILRRADLCVPDGVGLLWAARQLGGHLPERVTGSDGLVIIAERAAREGWKLFFLGAAPGIAEQAAQILQARFVGLNIVGTYAGSPAPEEEDQIVNRVNASGADILFVAYGAPRQDKWIARNLPRLQVKMAMGVGGAFDFVAGIIPRAPLWMQRAGLEWLYRLYLEPWRIRRQIRLPLFVLAVWKQRFFRRRK